jgi:hypothetical protein
MALLSASLGCAPALREPAPLPPPSAGPSRERASQLLAEAEAEWALRPDAQAVRRADSLFTEAAAADEEGVAALVGAVQAKAWLVEHEPDRAARAAEASSAVDAAQWCDRRAPGHPACDYVLAIALGLQARERHATATEGLKLMVERLRRAAAKAPDLDAAGPERVLALVLLRAPAWPLGPGDAEAGLVEARKAVGRFPDHPPNQLTLAEALAANGAAAEARAAAERGLALARARVGRDPDAPGWASDGERLLAHLARPKE